jgi:hypothetical protein
MRTRALLAALPLPVIVVAAMVPVASGGGMFLAGGEQATKSSVHTGASKQFVIHLNVIKLGPRTLRFRGTTNLPNRAVIQLSASRAFRNKGESDPRAVNAGSRPVVVSRGRFSGVMALDEKTLLVGVPSTGRIAVVDNAVTACAEFQTGRDFDGKPRQPDANVRRIVGPNGERLKGSPQVTVFGSLTPKPSNWLEVETRVGMSSPLIGAIIAAQGTAPTTARLEGFCLS